MNKLLTIVVVLAVALTAAGRQTSLNSADGIVWEICPQDNLKAVPGTTISVPGFVMGSGAVEGIVPGTTFAAYVAAGKEANPEWGDNIYLVDETYYNRPFWYRAEFDTPALADGEHLWLNFDNTHRYADFYFNGVKISGSASSTRDVKGHMVRSCFDVTGLLKSNGRNAVAVLITDPDTKKTRDAWEPYGITCSPSYMSAAGWDWMPYIPGRLSGITGRVYLSVTGGAVIADPWVRGLTPDNSRGDVKVQATLRNVTGSRSDVTLRGTINPGNITFEKTVSVNAKGEYNVSIDATDCPALNIADARLWYPNGYGDPNLYTCTLEAVLNGQVTDSREVTFGIRNYEWKETTNSEGYPVLELWVNGVKTYVKGGNWGISEYLLRCHGEEYEQKIRLHKEINFNMIRLWTGCVTDEEFYDYCDRYGIMVWDDFWLYVAFNAVAEPDVFKQNAREKVVRLRNHPCIAMWCGANETHPATDLDNYLREMIAEVDGGDRWYKSCSNDEGLSGSGWWMAQTPDRYFESAANALAFGDYRFSDTAGYGMRTELGMGTFPNYESVIEFMPEESRWPLPDDDTLDNADNTVWNHHFFGKEGSAAAPADYKRMVNAQYGESAGLQEFCDKAQLLNIESMKGMFEAWNDKMWNDATGLLLWMSNPAYPSFLWQTYDYYYDTTGAYWGARSACEHLHVQWNSLTGNVKVVNTTGRELAGAIVEAKVYDINGKELTPACKSATVSVDASTVKEVFRLPVGGGASGGIRFIRLRLLDADGSELSRNLYWHNNASKYKYTALNALSEARVDVTLTRDTRAGEGHYLLTLENTTGSVAFANRVRLVNPSTGERILPAIMSDNFVTLMPGESRTITVEAPIDQLVNGADVLLKQFGKPEYVATSTGNAGVDTPAIDTADTLRVSAIGNGKLVIGWNDGNERAVYIYNVQGGVVFSQPMRPMESVQLPSGGLYIVKAGQATAKVTVK